MPDLLETIRSELDTRLHDLRPLVSEYEQLLASTTDEPSAVIAPSASGPVETDLVSTSLVAPSAAEASPAATSDTPLRLVRPRRAIRPAWPKAPRKAGARA